MEASIELKHVDYTYQDGTHALRDVNVCFSKGEITALIGANGAGKSTLLLCLNGIFRPDKGEILVNHKKVGYNRKQLLELRHRVGIVFQDPDTQLFSPDVFSEIAFGVRNLGYDKKEVREKVLRIMEEMNLASLRDRPTHFLSGGQKKRVSIADVLVMEPEVVVFDEPAAAMDSRHAAMMDEIILRLKAQGKTVLVSTHDMDRAFAWADRVVLMHEGRVQIDLPAKEFFLQPALLAEYAIQQPAVARVFQAMQQAGLPAGEEVCPRDLEALCRLIEMNR